MSKWRVLTTVRGVTTSRVIEAADALEASTLARDEALRTANIQPYVVGSKDPMPPTVSVIAVPETDHLPGFITRIEQFGGNTPGQGPKQEEKACSEEEP